jgi:outer membrane autotransporter protein
MNEPGFDFDGYNFTAGVDYRFTENLVLGTAFGYAHSEADIKNNGGDVESDGYGASLYGTYYVGQMYVDVIGVYGIKDYTVARNVNYSVPEIGGGTTTVDQAFEGDPDAEEYGISGGVGYNLYLGGFNFQPYARLHYLKTEIDGYRERLSSPANTNAGFGLALDVEDQSVTSLVSAVGGQVAYTINTGIGVFIPQVNFDWQHEYENDARVIRASFVNGLDDPDNLILIPTDDPDRDYFGLGVGCSAVFPHGMSGFAYYDTILSLDDVTSHRVTLGLRLEI